MRLIVVHRTGDEFVAYWDDTYGIEYKSKDDFLIDLEIELEKLGKNEYNCYTVKFCGIEFEMQDKDMHNIDVYTVDEWFEKQLKENNS